MRKLNAELPRSELLVRILVPKGGCERLRKSSLQAKAGEVPALYGVPVVEWPDLPSDSQPWGRFADGSIRPLWDIEPARIQQVLEADIAARAEEAEIALHTRWQEALRR
jgi:hypothetical protein